MSVITISRPLGAGGRTLGHMLAKRLGYTFISNEIIQLVAERAKVSPGVVEAHENEAGWKFQRFLSGFVPKTFVDRLFTTESPEGFSEEIYVDLLHKIIDQIAQEGNAVILGRGAQFILKGYPDAYHLLLAASRENRIRFLQEYYDLTVEQAVKALELEDGRRANLYRKFGRDDYDQGHHYHLVLNMDKLSLEDAVEIVFEMIHPAT